MITSIIEKRLYGYLGGIIGGQNGIALEINGMPDHVHLLVKLSQNRSIADVLRELKADSSGWVHQEFPSLRAFRWQLGYAAFTVSESQVERVRVYIRNQKQHHRKITFQEEMVALLRAHRVDFEAKYLWK